MSKSSRIFGVLDFDHLVGSHNTFTIRGEVVSDAKKRTYSREYKASRIPGSNQIKIQRADGTSK